MHNQLDIRGPALTCVERLAQMNPSKIRRAGFESTLRRIAHEMPKASTSSSDISETRRRHFLSLVDDPFTKASDVLSLLERSGDLPM